ncbi:MAG: DUF4136 domain-containing protein [Sphingomonadaceae bacterium]|nr:DUF4136 domain-containing protein [Sphingomonadaceae bacterium]
MNKLLTMAVIVGAVAMSACQTGPARGVEVTRFHLGQDIPAQAINVEPANPADQDSLEFRTYAGIVAEEMARLGFHQAPLPGAEMIAVVEVSRDSRVDAGRGSPFSIGIGGGTFGSNVGVGVGTSVGVGGSRGGEISVTQLDVKLKRRSEGTIVWEGRAIRETRPGEEDPATVVRRLAAAMFSQFPGESGQTIRVD